MRRWPLHPLLIAAYPVLFLWSRNVNEVEAGDALPLLGTVVAVVAFGWLALRVMVRDTRRAALVASAGAALYLSYGHVWGDTAPWIGLTVWTALLAGAVVGVRRLRRGGLDQATSAVNVVGAVLVALTLVPLVGEAAASPPPPAIARADVPTATGNPARDIYYIILDRYGREDSLREVFGFDNQPFVRFLESYGFDVAERSLANYPKTAHSMAASLNMTYLDDLERTVPADDADDWGPVYGMLRRHRVGEVLTGLGYEYVHVGNWWWPTATADDADRNLTYDASSEFAQVFELTTALPALRSVIGVDTALTGRELKRNHSAYQLDLLDDLADDRGHAPRFVLVHITLPHEPYVFAADGSYVPPELEASRDRTGNFVPQLEYLNARMQGIVARLLADRTPEDAPIVVIQADEGPHPERRVAAGPAFLWVDAPLSDVREKLRILNAYHLPGVSDEEIPEDITPVNTFRLVLSHYFGADLPPLDDRAYLFPDESHLYEYVDVTEQVRG